MHSLTVFFLFCSLADPKNTGNLSGTLQYRKFTIACPGDLGVNRNFSSGANPKNGVKLKLFYFDPSIYSGISIN